MKQARHTPWLFLGPNLVIFGVFTFLPIAINLYYAFTGGVELYPRDRPFVGFENLVTLLDCGNHFDPSTCRKDIFWRAVWNTARFALFQVSLMVLFSLVTALVLNRKIVGRGFWRGVFFYPVLLSPVVVALIWKWILQREGLLNAGMVAVGAEPVLWLAEPGWAFSWVIFVSIWAHMGFYTLILLAGLQAIRAVQIFDEVFVLTGGGPGSATTFVVQFIYQTGFQEQVRLYGLAAAGSLLLALALIVLTLIQLRATRADEAGERAR
jgi:alpha-1,4-digalacturonate transport system permease protein